MMDRKPGIVRRVAQGVGLLTLMLHRALEFGRSLSAVPRRD
jgi:hypothetical protein